MATKKTYLLRIDPDLWSELQRWAADELRSVNGQIEYILRQAVKDRRRKRVPSASDDGSGDSPQRPG
jgi:hypothetical protein